ncbi:hypothetical protein LTR35_011746 [Friedmanniomyces endolithicus]|uniref:TEA domain-containing protein n=1 Tax=Friedmanniomyces endolithicus TaxID=329885 RepID=A0A4U0TYD0_9PEZI|nr:hypothetical protein LTS09_015081 [Friedmanniomyces endolithicus]KAK0272976.1 hypothetical protein LTS00_015990 [Friedmanniomyces endolithicus]KAK0274237.1 hypothetical protein LTR35_011746 [Friedmanniomyces endolithicus]KAK0311766.1 hypothetical protein LTR82_014138 [Friedmanniomyces endolithicus]KAK0983622.1 hypothetical protein LTR54_014287 [Friedmanniomyces endolithicus]
MLQPAPRVLPSNAPPLHDDGDSVQHASRVLQEHSGNRQQQLAYPASAIYEPKYTLPLHTENTWPGAYQQYHQQQQHVHHHAVPSHQYNGGQQFAIRARHPPYDYQHADDERNDLKKAADLFRRFQACAGYAKYRDKQQAAKDEKAAQEQKWPDDLEEAFFRALVKYPPMGRRKLFYKDKQRGRNELIADYIQQLTGVERGRKQVSSHIQVLKPFVDGVPQIMRYLSTKDMGHNSNGRHCSSHYGASHLSGRHMSTYPAAGLPSGTRSGGASSSLPRQNPMEEVRKGKNRLDIFEPRKFEMFVQRKYCLVPGSGQWQEERLHTYTQSIDAPLGDDLQLTDWQAFVQSYPLLAVKHAQKPLDCNVVVADASIGFPSESFRELNGVELGISFVCGSSQLDTDFMIRYRNTFYRKGQQLADPEEFDAPLQMTEGGRGVTTSLKFGSSVWAKTLHQLAARLMKQPVSGAEEHDIGEEVRNGLAGLTAMVEVIVVSPHGQGHERVLVMCWTFRKSSVVTGRASWKRLLLPQQQPQQQQAATSTTTQYPEPAKSERVDSVYDHAAQQYDDLPALEIPTQPALQSPFEYESSTGSALPSATWPTSALSEDGGGFNAAPGVHSGVSMDLMPDNSFDFNGAAINVSYDPGLSDTGPFDFSSFDAGFDTAGFECPSDFIDPDMVRYEHQQQLQEQMYDGFNAAPVLSAFGASPLNHFTPNVVGIGDETPRHAAPIAQMEGVVAQGLGHVQQVFPVFDVLEGTSYESQQQQQQQQGMYQPMGHEQQAYGGACGPDAGSGGVDPLGALADASYMRSLMPKEKGM